MPPPSIQLALNTSQALIKVEALKTSIEKLRQAVESQPLKLSAVIDKAGISGISKQLKAVSAQTSKQKITLAVDKTTSVQLKKIVQQSASSHKQRLGHALELSSTIRKLNDQDSQRADKLFQKKVDNGKKAVAQAAKLAQAEQAAGAKDRDVTSNKRAKALLKEHDATLKLIRGSKGLNTAQERIIANQRRLSELFAKGKITVTAYDKATKGYSKQLNTIAQKASKAEKAHNNFSEGMDSLVTSTVVALGPLSGVASRMIALRNLMRGDATIAVASIASGMVALTGAMITSASASALLHTELGQISARLTTVGKNLSLTTDEVDQFARKLGRDTLTSATEARKAFSVLIGFTGLTSDQMKRTLVVAQDLSSLGFGSLESQARRLGKALNDPASAMTIMRKAGVSLTANQKKLSDMFMATGQQTEAATILLKAFEDQIGGTAKGQAVGLAAALDTLGENTTAFWQALGEGSASPLEEAVNVIANGILKFTESATAMASVRGVFVGLANSIKNLIEFVAEYTEAIKLAAKVGATLAAFKLLGVALTTVGKGFAFAAKGAALAGISFDSTKKKAVGLFAVFSMSPIGRVLKIAASGAALLATTMSLMTSEQQKATNSFLGFNAFPGVLNNIDEAAKTAVKSIANLAEGMALAKAEVEQLVIDREATIVINVNTESLGRLDEELKGLLAHRKLLEDSLQSSRPVSPIASAIPAITSDASALLAHKAIAANTAAQKEFEDALKRSAAGAGTLNHALAVTNAAIEKITARKQELGSIIKVASAPVIANTLDDLKAQLVFLQKQKDDIVALISKTTPDLGQSLSGLRSNQAAAEVALGEVHAHILNVKDSIEKLSATADNSETSFVKMQNRLKELAKTSASVFKQFTEGEITKGKLAQFNIILGDLEAHAKAAKMPAAKLRQEIELLKAALAATAGTPLDKLEKSLKSQITAAKETNRQTEKRVFLEKVARMAALERVVLVGEEVKKYEELFDNVKRLNDEEKFRNELIKLRAKLILESSKAADKAAKAMRKPYTDLVASIDSSFKTLFKNMLAGTGDFVSQFKSAIGDAFADIGADVLQSGLKGGLDNLLESAGGKSNSSGLLGNLGNWLTGTTTDASGNAKPLVDNSEGIASTIIKELAAKPDSHVEGTLTTQALAAAKQLATQKGATMAMEGLTSTLATTPAIMGPPVALANAGVAGSLAPAIAPAGFMAKLTASVTKAVPWVALAAVVAVTIDKISGGKLFGTSFKETDRVVDISGSGGSLSGGTTITSERQRALFQGTRTRVSNIDLTKDELDALEGTFDAIRAASVGLGQSLEMDLTAQLRAATIEVSAGNFTDALQATTRLMVQATFEGVETVNGLIGIINWDDLAGGLEKIGRVIEITSSRAIDFDMTSQGKPFEDLGKQYDADVKELNEIYTSATEDVPEHVKRLTILKKAAVAAATFTSDPSNLADAVGINKYKKVSDRMVNEFGLTFAQINDGLAEFGIAKIDPDTNVGALAAQMNSNSGFDALIEYAADLEKADLALATGIRDTGQTYLDNMKGLRINIEKGVTQGTLDLLNPYEGSVVKAKANSVELLKIAEQTGTDSNKAWGLGLLGERKVHLEELKRLEGAAESTASAISKAVDQWLKATDKIKDWLKTFDLRSDSPLTALERLQVAQTNFDTNLEAARGGDIDAVQQATKFADQLLRESAATFANTAPGADISESVRQAMIELSDMPADPVVAALQEQLAADLVNTQAVVTEISNLNSALMALGVIAPAPVSVDTNPQSEL